MPTHLATVKDNLPPTRRTCSRCGRLGHRADSERCPRTDKAHNLVGVEVEGWWRNLGAVQTVAEGRGMGGTADGSLEPDRTRGDDATQAWEFRTAPGSVGEAISQVIAVYPDKYHRSAGMHIHVSFPHVHDVTALTSAEFYRYFVGRWEAWGAKHGVNQDSEFWKRLRGDNQYCARNDRSESDLHYQRVDPLNTSRYKHLNFTSWRVHKTVECRLLPLFCDLRLAVLAIEECVSIYEDYLATHVDSEVWSKFDREHAVATDLPSSVERELEIPDSEIVYDREIAIDGQYVHSALNSTDRRQITRWNLAWQSIAPIRITRGHDLGDVRATGSDVYRQITVAPVLAPTPGHMRVFGYDGLDRVMRAQLRSLETR